MSSRTKATEAAQTDAFLAEHHLAWENGRLQFAGHDLASIAQSIGTPAYVYSRQVFARAYHEVFSTLGNCLAVPPRVCYALKANPHVQLVREVASGGGGADVVSIGEFQRAVAAGIPPGQIVFSGVGKRADEIAEALRGGVGQLNVESEEELTLIEKISEQVSRQVDLTTRMALRINPDVDACSHDHIATGRASDKFGVPLADCLSILDGARARKRLRIEGLAMHIGSQITDAEPFRNAFERLGRLVLAARAAGFPIHHLDLGGGLGIRYRPNDRVISVAEYGRIVADTVGKLDCALTFEFGRRLAGNAGVLLTTVLYRKRAAGRRLYIVDAGMNDLIRPALYDSYHELLPLEGQGRPCETDCDVAGPVCESSDILARGRSLPALEAGERLAVLSGGAYGAAMASTYNLRRLPVEHVV